MRRGTASILAAAMLLGASPGALAQTSPAAPAAPSAETMALARKVAARDDFFVMIQTAASAQVGQIETGLGDLTPEQKVKAEAIAKAKLADGMNRIVDLMAQAYAARFTQDQLRDIDAFLQTPTGAVYSQRLMSLLPTLQNLKGFDLKKDTLAETCAQIGKGCPTQTPPKPAGTK
jgi:hypothetical protein